MGSDEEVKQILKSLCFSHGWSYALFWSYDPINPLILRYEEGYKNNDEQSMALVDDMILHSHIIGHGIVGEAALTGKHQWLFSDTIFQCEHEFQNQFLSGFKTIAIIPVGSNGVVQLGSTQKIVESPEMLEQTTREMYSLSKPDQSLELDDTLFESLLPLEDSEINKNVHAESLLQELNFDDIFTLEDNPPPLLTPPDISESEAAPLKNQDDNIFLSNGDNDDDFGFDILNSYSLDDLYQLLADSPPPPPEEKKTWCNSFLDDLQENSMVIQEGNSNGDNKDLFDILGIYNDNSQDSSSSVTVSHNEGFGFGFGALQPPPPQPKGLFSELINSSLSNNSNTSSLTDYSCLNNNQSKRRKIDETPSSGHSSSSFFPQTVMRERITPLDDHHLRRNTLWIADEDRSSGVAGNSKLKKQPQDEEVKKKRSKAGESRKPRPKDRQMIQDRIKELRALIPNGAKCSIDTLLDLTIKHMVFMQSLAKYADKLKQPMKPKLVNKERERTWAVEVGDDDDESSVVCPIIVEDLNTQEDQLGQMMQLEMVCEESEQFLEITDVVKGLGLNILKGVMETRQGQGKGKMWAHFIVEANKNKPPHVNTNRIHVLCSLLHLFQQQHHHL